MRRGEFVLATAVLLAPSLAHSQVQRANDAADARTSPNAVEARPADPVTQTASERRSLMGMVMDVLIASAEQQSAREAAAHQPGRAKVKVARMAARPAPVPASQSSSDLTTRERIAVESQP